MKSVGAGAPGEQTAEARDARLDVRAPERVRRTLAESESCGQKEMFQKTLEFLFDLLGFLYKRCLCVLLHFGKGRGRPFSNALFREVTK